MKTRRRNTTNNVAASDEEEEPVAQTFAFNGQNYDTYQEMVDAKRQRNRDVLASSGLLEAKAAVDNAAMEQKRAATVARGLKVSSFMYILLSRVRILRCNIIMCTSHGLFFGMAEDQGTPSSGCTST